ncbi:MAG TPA: hypothetical protein VNZ22_18095, partial [Bacillota bacterium]|nr:hypothetical protein [Bacillota bacterium]
FNKADDFEFVRLLNIGSVPVDLAAVRFTAGITFDFASGALRYLHPGASALVVADLAAFQSRYGHACDASVAGEYTGSLANGGERLQWLSTNGVVLGDFTYGDSAPWPAAADGDGPSLLLRNPWNHPDPADPSNWMASAVPGGLPAGIAPEQTYATWRALSWDIAGATNNAISGPDADPDHDGLSNLLEYAFGLDPRRASVRSQPLLNLESVDGDTHLTLALRLATGAREAHLLWETSDDLRTWTADASALQLLDTQPCFDGTASKKYFDTTPVASHAGHFLRLRIAGP